MVETEVKKALVRLNPEIAAQPERADEVIFKLRSILLSVHSTGLVRANEEFAEWLKGNKTMPFGKNYAHVPVRLIDFEHIANNKFQLVNQFSIRNRETKRPDIVMFVNGFPLVVGETKTPVRPSVSWLDAASDIHDGYENSVPELFVPNVFSFATEGRELFYGAVRTPLEFWSAWRLNEGAEEAELPGLDAVAAELKQLLAPKTLLDILYNFTTYTTNKSRQRIKVVCRYQQYEGANRIVERVLENKIKRGLIWHFQGSGKSLLMLFAAQKMRRMPELKSPTVMIVVDRIDLDSQTQNVFKEAPNVMPTEDIDTLNKFLENDARYIIITTIFAFQRTGRRCQNHPQQQGCQDAGVFEVARAHTDCLQGHCRTLSRQSGATRLQSHDCHTRPRGLPSLQDGAEQLLPRFRFGGGHLHLGKWRGLTKTAL
jgi:type I restriction enzyme R subunit